MEENISLESLKEKERNIKDLATFISNRPSKSINQALYCMLIGAGASATSGIRTGQDLVKSWRIQVLNKYDNKTDFENLSIDEQIKKLKEYYTEYDEENEYSSLFGKIYDLPNQRRNFIEQEVAKASGPSIGYQYLNLLAENKFIETFFTTNFDDLLELSLAPLNSNDRPIVCAQDSSISNISITSHRTKIIKLHGDFLFNDLKSSSTETKDLKSNMEAKFAEFLKNYGLIVLGYAGNDESIMKVLESLLDDPKQDYLNNGLYWCIRKEDYDNNKINKKVKKLLSKNKVYYILIDGFDEFCAELTHEIYKLNNIENLLFHKSHERQFQELEEYYNSQKEKFSNNLLILNDIKNCISDTTNNESVSNISTQTSSEITKNNKFEENKQVDNAVTRDIRKLINRKEYNEAINIIDGEINDANIPSFLYNYYNFLKIECYMSLKQTEQALETIEKNISYNNLNKKDSNLQLYFQKSILAKTHEERINAINSAIEINEYDYNLWNRYADELIINKKTNHKNKENIIKYLKKSIELNNSSDNDAYIDLIDYVQEYYEQENTNEIVEVCNYVIEKLECIDPMSTACFKAKIEKINAQAKSINNTNNIQLYCEAKEIFNYYIENNKIYDRNIYYIDTYLNFCSKFNILQEIIDTLNKYNTQYYDSVLYTLRKSQIYLSNFRNLNKSIEILENIDTRLLKYSLKERDKYYCLYLKYLLYNQEYDKAFSIFNENITNNMLASKSLEAEILYNIDKNKFLDLIIKDFEDSKKDTYDFITYTYNLLKIEYYDSIYDLCKKLFSENNDEDIDKNNAILRINYNMAKKFGTKQSKITKTNLESIFKTKEDTVEKAACYILIDEPHNAINIFKKKIMEDYCNYYYYKDMPIFKTLNFNDLKLEAIDFGEK